MKSNVQIQIPKNPVKFFVVKTILIFFILQQKKINDNKRLLFNYSNNLLRQLHKKISLGDHSE